MNKFIKKIIKNLPLFKEIEQEIIDREFKNFWEHSQKRNYALAKKGISVCGNGEGGIYIYVDREILDGKVDSSKTEERVLDFFSKEPNIIYE